MKILKRKIILFIFFSCLYSYFVLCWLMLNNPALPAALYLDFDSFFASAEQHLRPELRGRPVGVIPLPSEHTCLIAASREAKKFGFKVGTPVQEARRICPHIIIVPARPDVYVRLHHEILNIIGNIIPIKAVRSIDEVFCELMLNEQLRATDIALRIKAALAKHTSPTLTCSIGLGPNELIAKIAAEMKKPDGLVTITKNDLPQALFALALRDVPGIAVGQGERLARAGITDMRGLLALNPKHARKILGGIEGEKLHAGLHGIITERPETKRGMFGHSRILPRNWCNPSQIAACGRLLLVKAARRMRREGFMAKNLSLSLRHANKESWHRSAHFEAVRDDQFLLCTLNALLRQAHIERVLAGAKTIHIMLSGLVEGSTLPTDLFICETTLAARERWQKLTDITDELSMRFGHSSAMLGIQKQPPGGYAGAKIAFGRIPDLADFDEPRKAKVRPINSGDHLGYL
jgi:DNA polymerase IV